MVRIFMTKLIYILQSLPYLSRSDWFLRRPWHRSFHDAGLPARLTCQLEIHTHSALRPARAETKRGAVGCASSPGLEDYSSFLASSAFLWASTIVLATLEGTIS